MRRTDTPPRAVLATKRSSTKYHRRCSTWWTLIGTNFRRWTPCGTEFLALSSVVWGLCLSLEMAWSFTFSPRPRAFAPRATSSSSISPFPTSSWCSACRHPWYFPPKLLASLWTDMGLLDGNAAFMTKVTDWLSFKCAYFEIYWRYWADSSANWRAIVWARSGKKITQKILIRRQDICSQSWCTKFM